MPNTLKSKLGEKTFSRENKIDKEKHYGKWIFATKVVQQNRKEIDFSNFAEIFKLISTAIESYKRMSESFCNLVI